MELPDIRYRAAPPNHRQLTLVAILERAARLAVQIAGDNAGGVLAHLDGHGRDARQRSTFLVLEVRGVPKHKDLRVSRNGAVRLHNGPPGAIEWSAQRLKHWARQIASRPNHCLSRDGPACGDN